MTYTRKKWAVLHSNSESSPADAMPRSMEYNSERAGGVCAEGDFFIGGWGSSIGRENFCLCVTYTHCVLLTTKLPGEPQVGDLHRLTITDTLHQMVVD